MKILYVGDSPTISTGFGVVSQNLVKQFIKGGHDVQVLGVNFFGDPYDRKEFPYPIYPCDKGNTESVYGYAKIWYLAHKLQPDLIFILNDPWIISKYIDYKPNESFDSIKLMAYYPIDAGPLKEEWAKVLTEKLVAQVCYSTFAENIVIEGNRGKRPKNLHQIYHGVDKKTFFPINQSVARMKLGLPVDSFIVGMVARNQYRKRFDILVKAFSIFAQDKKNAKLYLHTDIEDVGYDILDLAYQFKLDDKLILTEDLKVNHSVPKEMLNYIYNSFDVNTLISLGDGFGLPVAESMATGCPQIVSDHSCLKELVEGHGGLTVKNASWLMHTSGLNTWGGVTDVDDLVEKLNLMYHNKETRLQLAEDAYNFISQDKFDWNKIGDSFNQVIKDVYHIL